MRKRIGVSNTWNWKLAESTVLSLRSVSESLHPSQEDGLVWHPLFSSLSCAFVPVLILHALTPCTEQRWRHHRSFQTLGLILLKGGLCLSEWLVSRKAIQEYDFSTPNFIHSHEQLHTWMRELKKPKMLHLIQIKSCLWAEKKKTYRMKTPSEEQPEGTLSCFTVLGPKMLRTFHGYSAAKRIGPESTS